MRALSLPGWRESVSGVDLSALCLGVLNNSYTTSFASDQLFDMRAGPGSPRLHGGSINPSRLTVDFFHNSSGHRLRSLPVVRNNPCSAPSALRLHPEHPKTSTVNSSFHGLSLSPCKKTRISTSRYALICSATTMSGSGKPAYPHPPIVPRFIFGSPPSTARLTPSSRSTAMPWTTSRSSHNPRG